MANPHDIDRWVTRFPFLHDLAEGHRHLLFENAVFPTIEAGAVAYEEDWECPNYLMCIDGRTRVYKVSDGGREMLIYKVEAGGTCVLTTQCLLSGGTFPAQSIAEARTDLAAIPAPVFRRLMAESASFSAFVIADYTKLLSSLFALVDEVAFVPLEQRLARRLLAEADACHTIVKTHQQLADDVGSVREMVSRHLGEWERAGWVRTGRGHVEILDRSALATRRVQ